MKRPLLLFSIIILFSTFSSCTFFKRTDKKNVKFVVASTTLPDTANVYISGSENELGSWKANKVKLHKTSKSTWEITLKLSPGKSYEYKYTLGSWNYEALDSNFQTPQNDKLVVVNDTVIKKEIKAWSNNDAKYNFFLSKDSFNSKKFTHLLGLWNLYVQDNPVYASPDYADSGFSKAASLLDKKTLAQINWQGKGWLRAIIWVDSSLWNKQIALCIRQTGASEVYLNGKEIISIGKIGKNGSDSKYQTDPSWHMITLGNGYRQVLAVRFANYDISEFNKLEYPGGFLITVGPAKNILESKHLIELKVSDVIFTVVPFVLALLHFVMFIFYPRNKQNLYYSICLLGFTFMAVLNYMNLIFNTASPLFGLTLLRFFYVAVLIAALFGLLTTYSSLYKKLPRQYIFFTIAAIILGIWGMFDRSDIQGYLIDTYYGLVFIEAIRTFIKNKSTERTGTWLSVTGFIILLVSVGLQTLIDMQIIDSFFGETLVYGYGVFGLVIFMSLHLSNNFSLTNKNLEKQLINVKKLSDLALEQERKAKDEELKKQILEADNRRKTVELEEARELQLSMLPKAIPELPQCKIAVYMQTATEVGGDYYDFSLCNENTLTVTLGDATGHGARAGIMVAATKSLFSALAENPDTIQILKKFTSAIKSMKLHNLYMSLEIGKLKGRAFTFSNAGMPPLMHYSAKEKAVNLLIQKSMPLGSFTEFPYAKTVLSLEPDDILLFLSDGYTEAFNPGSELLGIDRCKDILKKYADLSPEEIIEGFKSELTIWSNGRMQDDDVSIIALKMN